MEFVELFGEVIEAIIQGIEKHKDIREPLLKILVPEPLEEMTISPCSIKVRDGTFVLKYNTYTRNTHTKNKKRMAKIYLALGHLWLFDEAWEIAEIKELVL